MPESKGNLFDIPDALPRLDEFVETLSLGDGLRVERIISHGHSTPDGEWYDQAWDEFVVLLQGRATVRWGDDSETSMSRGDWVFIPAHRRHRVISTSTEPPCVWLAVHGPTE